MRIRKAGMGDIPALARVHVDTWKATYKYIFSNTILQNFTYEVSENMFLTVLEKHVDEATCYVAEEEPNKIVGFAIGGLERSKNPKYQGELWGLYVSKEFHRKGVGKSLVSTVVENLLSLNINSMLVWVLKGNPYRTFYESLGGQLVGEKPTKLGQEQVIEIAYGWKNLRALRDLVGNTL